MQGAGPHTLLYGTYRTDDFDALAGAFPAPAATHAQGDLRVAGDIRVLDDGTVRADHGPDDPRRAGLSVRVRDRILEFTARGCDAPDLFVLERDAGCAFATDIRPLIVLLDSPALDREGLRISLTRGVDRTTRTLVQDVRRVPTDARYRPGHGAVSVEPPRTSPSGTLAETVTDAVVHHLDARPVVPLSGGIDSTTLAAVAADQGADPRGVVIDYGIDGPTAEHRYGHRVADHLGIERAVIDLSTAGEPDVRETVRRLAMPFAGVHWLHVPHLDPSPDETVLYGHGTEEVFFKGTDDMRQVHAAQRVRAATPRLLRRPAAALARATRLPRGRKAAALLAGSPRTISTELVSRPRFGSPSSAFLPPVREPDGVLMERYGYHRFYRNTAPVTRRTASVLPAASPFTDPALVAHGLSLPFDAKVRDGRYKAAFTDAVADHLPGFVLDRDQNQFADASRAWLAERPGLAADAIERLRARDLWDLPGNRRIERDPAATWLCLTLEFWLQEFIDR